MKRLLLGLVAFASVLLTAHAASTKHRVVFEVTSSSPAVWTAALNNVENLQKVFVSDGISIEVVAHGEGLGLLVVRENPVSERIKTLQESGVIFAACENTMKRQHVTKDQLLAPAKTVDSGVAEVVRKQEEGWSYLKTSS